MTRPRQTRGKVKAKPQDAVKTNLRRWWVLVGGLLAMIMFALVFAVAKHGRKLESGAGKSETTNAAVGSLPETVSSNSAVADEGPTNVTAASEQLNRGTRLLEQGDLDGATAQYEQAVKLNPDDEDAHYNLGLAYAKKGNRQAAEAQYLEALERQGLAQTVSVLRQYADLL